VDTQTKFFNSPQLNKGSFHVFKNLKAPLEYVITRPSEDYLVKERVRICSLEVFPEKYLVSQCYCVGQVAEIRRKTKTWAG